MQAQMSVVDRVEHGSSTGEVQPLHPGHGKVTSTIIRSPFGRP